MSDLTDPRSWCTLSHAERRSALAGALLAALPGDAGVRGVVVELGPAERHYDLTAAVETDVGVMRTALWSHARASIFCDDSIHPANRRQFSPADAVAEAAERLRVRLAVPYELGSRGLTLSFALEAGVERTWTAERSRFRGREAVTREDAVREGGDEDLRVLLGRFYTGPSVRAVGPEGQFLLAAAPEAEGPLVTLCRSCGRWQQDGAGVCTECGAVAEVVVAVRPPRREGFRGG